VGKTHQEISIPRYHLTKPKVTWESQSIELHGKETGSESSSFICVLSEVRERFKDISIRRRGRSMLIIKLNWAEHYLRSDFRAELRDLKNERAQVDRDIAATEEKIEAQKMNRSRRAAISHKSVLG
jgi:hypothetical protein